MYLSCADDDGSYLASVVVCSIVRTGERCTGYDAGGALI